MFVILCVFMFAALLGLVALRGVVLASMFNWFVVPVFHLPELHLVAALGIAAMLNYLLTDLWVTREKPDFGVRVFVSYFVTLIVWFVGWLLHFGM